MDSVGKGLRSADERTVLVNGHLGRPPRSLAWLYHLSISLLLKA